MMVQVLQFEITYIKGIRYYQNFGSVRTVNFTSDMYTNDSLHGVFSDHDYTRAYMKGNQFRLIRNLKSLASVAAQAGLCLTWSETHQRQVFSVRLI